MYRELKYYGTRRSRNGAKIKQDYTINCEYQNKNHLGGIDYVQAKYGTLKG